MGRGRKPIMLIEGKPMYTFAKEISIKDTDYNRRRKLTKDQISAIRTLREAGYSGITLAKIFNVAPATIYYHCDPEHYKKIHSDWYNANYTNRVPQRMEYYRDLVMYKKQLREEGKV